jgi:NAD-dependent dihydropyrimidine dehydrogenase PreA subunit
MFMIYVDDKCCNGCGECVDVCPTGALIFQNNHAFIDQEFCQGCQACIDACPIGAILSGDQVPASQDVIHIPGTISAQVQPQMEGTYPISMREVLLPAVGSMLLWVGREIVPRLAEATLGYLDRRIQSTQSIPTGKNELIGGGRASKPTPRYGRGRRRRRRKNRRSFK